MTRQSYKKRLDSIRNNKVMYCTLEYIYKFLPLVMVAVYPFMIIIKGFKDIDLHFWLMIGVPAFTLVLITVMRKVIKRQRPYDKFNTPPLFERDGEGESFPSRHTASAFIIAMSGFVLSPYLGAGLLIIAVLIGISRILSGVHFASDVLAGMLISTVLGIISFIII